MTIKIFLGNLSSDTTSDKLRPLFEKYGEVVECDVLSNFGFVHMTNKGDANKAIAQLDGYSVDGKNIRVELSTGKGRGGSGGKDRKGFGRGGRDGRDRPYGPPPGRGEPRDYDYYPPPRPFYDRYDPYYRYFMEREAFYSRDRLGGGDRDMYPPIPPRDRYPDPRDRLPPPRPYLDDRSRALPPSDPYFREGVRPPPEYYERKGAMGAGGRGPEPLAAGAAAGRGSAAAYNGAGNNPDYYRRQGGANPGGAAGGAGSGDYYRQNGVSGGFGRGNMGGGMGNANKADSQSSFATDPIFF